MLLTLLRTGRGERLYNFMMESLEGFMRKEASNIFAVHPVPQERRRGGEERRMTNSEYQI